MEKNQLRIGIIGTNFVSGWLAEAAQTEGSFVTQAVYSRKQETGDAFAAKYGIPEVYTDAEAFFSSDSIDAVYIASPNFAHAGQAIQALEHGKHVLCEKVIATNSNELSQMLAAAEKNDRVLMEAMRPAHDPSLALIKEQLPKLGKLRRVSFDFCQYSSRYDRFKSGEILNAFNPELSNAAIMDIGVYIVHVCALLFGRPQKLLSMSTFLHNGFEGAGHVLLDYGDMKAELSYSKITESATPNLIMGENGTLTFGKITLPKDFRIRYRDGRTEELPFTPLENNMVFELADFAKQIRSGEWHSDFLDASVLEMELIDEIRRQNGIVFPADRV